MRVTSCPARVSMPPTTDPIAPAPMMPILVAISPPAVVDFGHLAPGAASIALRELCGEAERWHWGKLQARSTQPSPRAAPSARKATRERAGSPRRTWVYVAVRAERRSHEARAELIGLPARSQRGLSS